MTPAIAVAKQAGIAFRIHEYQHDPTAPSYGLEAAQALGLDPRRVFKTLVTVLDANPKHLAVALVPVAQQLNLKALATAFAVKKAAMAEAKNAERATGYLVGGISPLGHKKRLPMLIDRRAADFPSIFVSAGRRGLEIELAPTDLLRLTGAGFADLATS